MFCVTQLSDKNLYSILVRNSNSIIFFLPSWYADIYSASKVFIFHILKIISFLYIFKSCYLHIFQDSLPTSPPQEFQLIPYPLAPSSKMDKVPTVKNLIFTYNKFCRPVFSYHFRKKFFMWFSTKKKFYSSRKATNFRTLPKKNTVLIFPLVPALFLAKEAYLFLSLCAIVFILVAS